MKTQLLALLLAVGTSPAALAQPSTRPAPCPYHYPATSRRKLLVALYFGYLLFVGGYLTYGTFT